MTRLACILIAVSIFPAGFAIGAFVPKLHKFIAGLTPRLMESGPVMWREGERR